MCGIVGYVGHRGALPVLINGLKHLEYRGYDSAGVLTLHNSVFEGEKKVGKIALLEQAFQHWQPAGTLGIGHTRWATHGPPSHANAHPHLSADESVAIVHNGILENYLELRHELAQAGVELRSETDSEMIAHFLQWEREAGHDLIAALQRLVPRFEGSWGLLAVARDEPHRIVAARKDSPMIVGLGENETFLASDVPAILEYTRRVIYLEEGDIVDANPSDVRILDREGREVERSVHEIQWSLEKAQKGGEPHFMRKEIKEQPQVLADTIHAYLRFDDTGVGRINFPDLTLADATLQSFDRVVIAACGTAWHAGLVAKYLIEEFARLPVECQLASELRYAEPIITPNTLVIAVTQSGETEDTKKALIRMRELGATAVCVCNVLGSSIPRECEGVIYTVAGPEIAVASTKAYTTQVAVLTLFAIHLGRVRGTLEEERASALLRELDELPAVVRETLGCDAQVEEVAKYCSFAPNFMYLGRHVHFPTALEGALKLKEITYIHAEGYPAGEMKHGPIALVDNTFPVVAMLTKGRVLSKVMSNLKEIEARNGIIIAVKTKGLEVNGAVQYTIEIPETSEALSPIVAAIPMQLLAYHVSVNRQIDPDKPRNLAKSVTVE